MSHSCIASLRVIHASKERETLHNIPDLAISMACSHLCVLFSSCVYIHTAHTQPTSATHSSTGRLLRETYAVITALMLAGRRPASGSGQPAEPFLHSCMLQSSRKPFCDVAAVTVKKGFLLIIQKIVPIPANIRLATSVLSIRGVRHGPSRRTRFPDFC